MITKQQRKEYLLTIFALFVTSFIVYGCLSIFLEDTIFDSVWKDLLIFGSIAGYGFSSILSGILLFTRFISKRGLIFKVICCCLFPFTIAVIVYIGVFLLVPYGIYNIYAIMQTQKS